MLKHVIGSATFLIAALSVGCSSSSQERVGQSAAELTLTANSTVYPMGATTSQDGSGAGSQDYSHTYDLATVCSVQWPTVSGSFIVKYYDDGATPNPHYNFTYQIILDSGSDEIDSIVMSGFNCGQNCASLDVDYRSDLGGTIPPANVTRSVNADVLNWFFTGGPIMAGDTSRVMFVNTLDTNSPGSGAEIFINGDTEVCEITTSAKHPG